MNLEDKIIEAFKKDYPDADPCECNDQWPAYRSGYERALYDETLEAFRAFVKEDIHER